MLGYDVSFSYIHAVTLAQQGNILEKRVGMYDLCSANWQEFKIPAMVSIKVELSQCVMQILS
jgi:hypothetical protein